MNEYSNEFPIGFISVFVIPGIPASIIWSLTDYSTLSIMIVSLAIGMLWMIPEYHKWVYNKFVKIL